MTENNKNQTGQSNQNGNQGKNDQNNQRKDGVPTEKTAVKDEPKIKPIPAEEEKEREDRDHPHETSIPVSSNNVPKSGL